MWFWNRKKEGKVGKYEEIPFQHLAPIDSVEDKTIFDALDYALSQNNVHNIALTGNYGSGKSSILESYIKRNRKKNVFLKISLATFAVENKNENIEQENIVTTSEVNQKNKEDNCTEKRQTTNSKSEFSETILQKIEKSILQQILYRKSGIKLPNSRFIRIKRTNKVDVAVTEIVILAIFLVSNYFIHGKFWDYICRPLTIPLKWDNIALSISLSLALFLFLYKIILFAKRLRIAKLCFNNAEIEFKGSENEESLLNKYLDELLYFFEVTKYNVVVFEDLDRFNNTEIFIKLRELNTLLNNYEKIDRKVIFVYALRDEVFRDSSRTKFFDFIIPVIPVINNQNSGDVLYNYWMQNRGSVFGKIDENFLQDIGLFVDDMRLLINTINEFKIYDQKINKSDYIENKHKETKVCRDRNKIFALILYKNLYPSDFALLVQNKGELYKVFQNKARVIKNKITEIKETLSQQETQLKNIENQFVCDIESLRMLYVAKAFSKAPPNTYISQNINDFLSDDGFRQFQSTTSLVFTTQYNQRQRIGYVFSDIEREIDPQHSYADHEKFLKIKLNDEVDNLRKEMYNNKKMINDAKQMPIAEICLNFPVDELTKDLKNVNKNLIIYLLSNRFIDENYFEYISYFYANSLNEQEQQYLLLIKSLQAPNFNLSINNFNFGKIVARINDAEWKLPAVLNYSMLYYIIKFDDSHIDLFLKSLWNYKLINQNTLFLSKFDADPKIQSKLYQILHDLFSRENNWLDILFGDEEPNVVYNFFIYANFEKTENDVITFLTNDVSYLHRIDTDKDTVASKINYYGLKFNLLEDTANYPVYDVLLDNAAYIVSKNNFDIIIKHANGDAIEEPVKDYYTQISKLKNQNIKAYVDQNIEVFVNDIVLSTGDSMAESEGAFIELLNDENLMTETKAKLIEKNNCVVSDITQIKGVEIQLADGENKSIDIRNLLYKCKKVSPTWSNVFEYFKYNGNKLDLCLVEYLNDDEVVKTVSKEKPLSTEELKEKSGNYDIVSTFYNVMMHANALSLNSFSNLMDACPWIYNSLGSYDVSPEKMKILIEMDKLSLTKENYYGIKQNYSELLPNYVSVCFDDFLEKWSELKIEITFDDMKLFLDSDELNKEQKNRLLSSDFDAWYTVNQKDSLMWLGRKMLELNFEGKIQVSIASVITNMDDTDDVLKLLCLQGRNLKDNEIIDLVNNKLDESYRICIKRDGKREKLPNTSMNKELCAILSEKEIISSYQEDGKKIKVIQKRM